MPVIYIDYIILSIIVVVCSLGVLMILKAISANRIARWMLRGIPVSFAKRKFGPKQTLAEKVKTKKRTISPRELAVLVAANATNAKLSSAEFRSFMRDIIDITEGGTCTHRQRKALEQTFWKI